MIQQAQGRACPPARAQPSGSNIPAEPPIVVSLGVAWWKKPALRRTLAALNHGTAFAASPSAALRLARRRGGAVGVWAAREPEGLRAAAAQAGVPVVRIEDGFLRSVGLGADFIPAASLILDRRGVYYDPSAPSDLEALLESDDPAPSLLARACALREEIVRRGLSKYNTGDGGRLERPPGRRVVLVPGQVEDDRSVQRGGAGVAGNLDLLRRVRAAEPDAFVVYKPHPDVEAGHRAGHTPDAALRGLADRVVRHASMPALLAGADAVHTLTSLSGFEALLRGVPVVVWGQPFYAGWGLTDDRAPPLPRRTRRLTLDALVAGALIRYPAYVDPVTGRACEAEDVVRRLAEPALRRPDLLVRLRRIEGRWMRRWRTERA